MKKLIHYDDKCTGCCTCEDVCSRTWFKKADRSRSVIRVVPDGDKYRIDVCDQCGDCTKMCTSLAVQKAANGVVRINKDKCVGCLICVAECLRGFLFYHDDEPVPFKCTACGLCAKSCASGALALTEV